MSAHTPGPWYWADNAIYGSSGLIKPLIAYLDDRFADEETANNARLIVAAPELLAFAERVANLPEFAHYLTLIDAARELVAKAGTAPAREVTK
jgi:hypothetical protein